MVEPLTFAGESATLGASTGRLTLVAGAGFCISAPSGDMIAAHPHGLFFRDTRFLSTFRLRVGGAPPETLATIPDALQGATVVARQRRPNDTCSLLVFRRRSLAPGFREEVELRNAGPDPVHTTVELEVSSDFAGLFEVKEGRVQPHQVAVVRSGPGGLTVTGEVDGHRYRTTLAVDQPFECDAGVVRLPAVVPAKGDWRVVVEVTACVDGGPCLPPPEQPAAGSTGDREADRWRAGLPELRTDDARLRRAWSRSLVDLAGLRVTDDRYGPTPVLAAGAPWFMTLFGRDSIIASWMVLLVDPSLALSTLRVLAALQGEGVDDRTEEQPGRILHEVRFGRSSLVGPGGGDVYYGTADATPLFVMLAGEMARWGASRDDLVALLPAVDRALEWIDGWGDADGDGYVDYRRRAPGGLANQGWKDSWDAISRVDGTLAEPPIALCEVQGYVYAAFEARATLASLVDDHEAARHWHERAAGLRARFDSDFWLDDLGRYALALDGDGRPVDGLGSNAGHLLWTGIVPERRAPAVAAALVGPDLFSGWGLRTLSRRMPRYDPLSYHNGSVWPHDTALAAAGLARYGCTTEAGVLLGGLLDAADHLGGHLPELFSGLDRSEAHAPVEYPSSSMPQAWAAAASLLAVRTLLGLQPDLVEGRVTVALTHLPGLGAMELTGVRLGDATVSLRLTGERVTIDGLLPTVSVD